MDHGRLAKRLKKHIAVDTRALAAHFSFFFQTAIEHTDILDVYADYANKTACLDPHWYGILIFEDKQADTHRTYDGYHARLTGTG